MPVDAGFLICLAALPVMSTLQAKAAVQLVEREGALAGFAMFNRCLLGDTQVLEVLLDRFASVERRGASCSPADGCRSSLAGGRRPVSWVGFRYGGATAFSPINRGAVPTRVPGIPMDFATDHGLQRAP